MPEHETPGSGLRGEYQRRMLEIRAAFYAGAPGAETIAARSQAMDQLIRGLWEEAEQRTPGVRAGIVLLALGGYGRSELFPYSDVDLLYLLDGKVSEQEVKQPIRRVSQELWDVGIRLSPVTRKRSEVERFDADNVESTLALLDHRLLAGDGSVYERFSGTGFPKLLEEKGSAIAAGLAALTAVLDSCALLISVVPGVASRQARLTFAMARHALVDLGHVFQLEKQEAKWRAHDGVDRLPPANFELLCGEMKQMGMRLCGDPEAPARLHALRALYEPHAHALAAYLGLSLPLWMPEPRAKDQWKTVEAVRSQAASVLKDSVVSDQSEAIRLHPEERR